MIHVACRLTAKNGISSGTLRSVIEYGLALPSLDSEPMCVTFGVFWLVCDSRDFSVIGTDKSRDFKF